MAEQPMLHVTRRRDTGSHIARRLRKEGRIPGTLYGHGAPLAVTLDAAEFRGTVRPSHYGSQMVRLNIDDRDGDTALVKAVQIQPLGQRVLNVDLQRVSLSDEIVVSVSVVLEGDAPGVRAGGVLEQLVHTAALRCTAGEIPDAITVDISHLEIGDTVHSADIQLPAHSTLVEMASDVIAILAAPRVAEAEAEAVEAHIDESAEGPALVGEKQHDDFPSER